MAAMHEIDLDIEGDVLQVPLSSLTEESRVYVCERVYDAMELGLRNSQIRCRYEALKEHMRYQEALKRLAHDYCLSSRQVRRIVHGT